MGDDDDDLNHFVAQSNGDDDDAGCRVDDVDDVESSDVDDASVNVS